MHATSRTAALLLTVVLAAGAGLTACGDDDDKGTVTPGGSVTATTSAPATAPTDLVAAKAKVKENWEKFFAPTTDLNAKAALLQNGEQLRPVLQGFGQDPRVGQVEATANDVSFVSPTTADVTYSLTLQGQVVAPEAAGRSVLENGTWKVSIASFCGLLTQAGTQDIPACG